MSQPIWKPTVILAGIILAGLPILVNAQDPSRRQGTPTTTSRQSQTSVDRNSPQYHLNEAKRVLNTINTSTMKGDTRTQFTELRTHFTQLESTWRAHMPAGRAGANEPGHVSGHVERGTTGTTTGGDWMSHYTAIDQMLSRMSSADAKLMEFRKHLEAFHQAAMSTSGTPRGALDQTAPDVNRDIAGQQVGVGVDPDVQQPQRPGSPTITVAPGQTIGLSASTTADSATITRLSAMIDEMLRGTASNTATGTAGSPGATAGTVCVERARLEQLRTMIDGLRSQQQ